jgi:hypothetical protein
MRSETGCDGRKIWQTSDRNYGLVVNPMAWGKDKWHVGYNYISNPNHQDIANDVSKVKAMILARNFRRRKLR